MSFSSSRIFAFTWLLLAGCAGDPRSVEDDGGSTQLDGSTPLDASTVDDASAPLDASTSPDAWTAPRCVGVAPSCRGRDVAACELGLGCVVTPYCIGFAGLCPDQTGRDACTAVTGCTWRAQDDRCVGSARACGAFDEASCDTQPGCAWEGVCSGVITPCDAHDEGTCETQIGCSWTEP